MKSLKNRSLQMKRTPEKAQHNRKKRPTPRYFIRKMQNINSNK